MKMSNYATNVIKPPLPLALVTNISYTKLVVEKTLIMKSQNTDQNIMNINAKVCVTVCKVGNSCKYTKLHVWHRVDSVGFQLVFKISCAHVKKAHKMKCKIMHARIS